MAKITYTNKVTLNEQPSVADINKVTDDDMNEIKSVVNTNDDNVGTLSNLNTTDKTSIVNAINELVNLKPVVLYNDSTGTTGTVTLSDSAANYSYIEIFYKNTDGYCSSVKAINGTDVSLTITYQASDKLWYTSKVVTINGISISNKNHAIGWINNSNNTGYGNTNNMKITRVIGYK